MCTKCGVEKPIEEFGWKDRPRNKKHAVCKTCTAVRSSKWYYENRDSHIQNVAVNSKTYRDEAREYTWNYLLTHPCVVCGETDPIVLEFDHFTAKKKL